MLENLLLTRVDDRLIHGQVMTAWIKLYPAKQILIVDDSVAKDDFMLFVLQNAAPSGIKVIAKSIDDSIKYLQAGLSTKTLILTKTPLNLQPIVDAGIDLGGFIIGGMGARKDRKPFYKNISASEDEKACLKYLVEKGLDVKIHITPDRGAVDVKGLVG